MLASLDIHSYAYDLLKNMYVFTFCCHDLPPIFSTFVYTLYIQNVKFFSHEKKLESIKGDQTIPLKITVTTTKYKCV